MSRVPVPDDLVDYLAFLETTRRTIEELEYRTVRLLRQAGVTQQEIADVLGVTRQTVAERYDRPHRPRARRRS